MDQARFVGCLQALTGLNEGIENLRPRRRGADPRVEALAPNELHGEIGLFVGLPHLVHGDDVGV